MRERDTAISPVQLSGAKGNATEVAIRDAVRLGIGEIFRKYADLPFCRKLQTRIGRDLSRIANKADANFRWSADITNEPAGSAEYIVIFTPIVGRWANLADWIGDKAARIADIFRR